VYENDINYYEPADKIESYECPIHHHSYLCAKTLASQPRLHGRHLFGKKVSTGKAKGGASMRRYFLLLASIVFFPNLSQAQYPCWDHETKGESQYPEIDSKCVQTKYETDRASFFAQVPGSQVPVKDDNDPVCTDFPVKVTCRRLCGDLPAGKEPGNLGPQGIEPGGWARFEQHLEVFPKGDHYRVCIRLKNWANESLGKGTPKYFSYSVLYTNPPEPSPAPNPPKELSKSWTPLPLLRLLGIGSLGVGSTLRAWATRR
jgi:hypothetical protein